ncbi:MAG TPA: c-type cytochrome, partial [bacterium]|nr:c-type cytochrome [bacterium]
VAAEAAKIPLSRQAHDIAAGAALYDNLHCDACHALGLRAAKPGIAAAPDLAHAAERMRATDIAAYVAAPEAFGLVTAMPSFSLTAEQAARIRDFLVASRASPASSGALSVVVSAPADLPLLTRTVGWDEVKDRVFGAVCIHCHMDEESNGGDGGPGNTGGLGFRGKGLSFESWDGVVRGALDGDGKRVSILTSGPNGEEPLLLAKLRARYGEVARERAGALAVSAGGAPAMPLGLPALSPEDFQLVRSWLAQGARGPDGRAAVRATPQPVLARTAEPEVLTCAPAFFAPRAPDALVFESIADPGTPLASASSVCPIHRREAE